MKIGITCYPTYGGSGVVATELGLELAQLGHEVHFISYAQPIRLTAHPNIHYHEVEVSRIRSSTTRHTTWRWRLAWLKLRSFTNSIFCTCTMRFRIR